MSVSGIKNANKLRDLSDLKVAFIVDGVNNFSKADIFHDSSFALMLAMQGFNVRVLLTESNNLKIINNKVFAKFDEVVLKQEENNHIKVKGSSECSLDSFNIIFARKDPPVNEDFLSYLLMLSMTPHFGDGKAENENKSKPLIVNSPEGMLKANEKLYALNFPEFIPSTIVTSKKVEILDFLNEYNEAVVKPLYDKGGGGVFYLSKSLKNVQAIIEMSIRNGDSVALVQKYIPEVLNGDKRIILLNGNPLGAILRIPKAGEFRANMSRGASVKACTLTERDLEICKALKPQLQRDGLHFAGIDVINGYLTEVNVTSPTGLQEIERFDGRQLAKEIVGWAIETSMAGLTV